MDLPAGLRILVVADEPDASVIGGMLAAPGVVVMVGDGTDETLLLAERTPFDAVVVTASLAVGDGAALVGALRDIVRPEPFHVVLIGDVDGPIRGPADASDLMIDRFVGRPVNRNSLRFAVLPRALARASRAATVAAEAPPIAADSNPFRREPTLAARPRQRVATADIGLAAPDEGFADSERESTIPGATTASELFDEPSAPGVPVTVTTGDESYGERLRDKMAEMARRLFQDTPPAARRAVQRIPTDVDFAAIDHAMSAPTPHEARFVRDPSELHAPMPKAALSMPVVASASIGALETGQISIGVSDAATLVARLWQREFTGQLTLSSPGTPPQHHQLFFVAGRLVFAATTAPQFRLGAILVREGKVTQEEARLAWDDAAKSGRRHGEVMVDRGLIKRRELLPALRRQLEAIVFSAFGWHEGSYTVAPDIEAGERVQLTRHTLALMAEGIRRKWSPVMLQRCLGDGETQFELGDRQKLKELLVAADVALADQEAVLGLAGRQNVGQFARGTDAKGAADAEDVLPLVWFATCLGAAHVFRPFHDESVLVSETDLAVDRARIRRHMDMASHGDYFILLGLPRDATRFEVRRAYEAMRREYAAESFPGAIRGEMARELAAIARALDEAYGVLVDDAMRQAYAQRLPTTGA